MQPCAPDWTGETKPNKKRPLWTNKYLTIQDLCDQTSPVQKRPSPYKHRIKGKGGGPASIFIVDTASYNLSYPKGRLKDDMITILGDSLWLCTRRYLTTRMRLTTISTLYRVSKKTHFQNAVGATVHWLNHK